MYHEALMSDIIQRTVGNQLFQLFQTRFFGMSRPRFFGGNNGANGVVFFGRFHKRLMHRGHKEKMYLLQRSVIPVPWSRFDCRDGVEDSMGFTPWKTTKIIGVYHHIESIVEIESMAYHHIESIVEYMGMIIHELGSSKVEAISCESRWSRWQPLFNRRFDSRNLFLLRKIPGKLYTLSSNNSLLWSVTIFNRKINYK